MFDGQGIIIHVFGDPEKQYMVDCTVCGGGANNRQPFKRPLPLLNVELLELAVEGAFTDAELFSRESPVAVILAE
jgi:hypothetical protein